MAIEFRLLRQGDEAVLAAVAADVFDNDVNERAVSEFLSDGRHHIIVAVESEKVGRKKRIRKPADRRG